MNQIGFFKSKLDYIYFLVHNLEKRKCEVCGRPLTFSQIKDNLNVCSLKCSKNTKEYKEKLKIIIKNIDYESKNEKFKKTCLEKYGTECPLSKKSSVRNEIEQHWKNLGVENPGQLQEIKDKIRQTNLEKYGNEIYLKSDEFKERYAKTCLEHFGVEHQFKCKEIQEKIKHTLFEKYNVKNSFLIDHIVNAQKESKHHESFLNLTRFFEYVEPMFNESEWEGTLTDKEYKWKCVKCGNEFYQKIYKTSFNDEKYMPRCLKCYPFINGFSYAELELLDFCRQYFPSAAKNKQLIKPLELDVVILEIKLAAEFNGSFYHSIERVGNNYHLNKTLLCNEAGYRLIHIWEDELINNKEEIKHRLEDIFLCRENLDFKDEEIKLDRSWYNNIEIPGYILKEELAPKIIERNCFKVENCGYFKYKYNYIL